VSRKSEKERGLKMKALAVALQSNLEPNPQSLSNSYGLPVSEVEHLIRSMRNEK
jgi:hypothetical protein